MTRDPGLFVWEECGRSFVTHFGGLGVSVSSRGSAANGTKVWRVTDVFGNKHLGGDWKALDDAILEAEALAVREGRALFGNMRRALIRGRRMPKVGA